MLRADVKTFLKVDTTEDDTLIDSLIATARRACEEYTQRAFISQTWRLTRDRFSDRDPDAGLSEGYSVGPTPFLVSGATAIQLSRLPVQSITHIKTTDSADVQTTVATSVYGLDAAGGRLLLKSGQSWPSDLRDEAAVEITTVNGYGSAASDVPQPIRQAIMQYVGAMYANRLCGDLPDGCKTLLAPFKSAEAFGAW